MCWTVDMIMQMKRLQMILGSPHQGITVAAWVLKRSVAVSLEVVIFVFNLDYAKLMFHAWSCPMLNYLKKIFWFVGMIVLRSCTSNNYGEPFIICQVIFITGEFHFSLNLVSIVSPRLYSLQRNAFHITISTTIFKARELVFHKKFKQPKTRSVLMNFV